MDTNVLVYAVEHHPIYGPPCERIVRDIESGRLEALCSKLVLVEFVHVLVRLNRGLDKRHGVFDVPKLTEALLSLVQNWADLDDMVVKRASQYTAKVNPPDYFHLATMELHGSAEVLSADRELDKVTWVKRIDPMDYRSPPVKGRKA